MLRTERRVAWAQIQIPAEALSLPLDQIVQRYVLPAVAQVLQQHRQDAVPVRVVSP